MDRKVIIIPTYNEKENIEKIIRAVFSLEGRYHVLVIEDGSPDGTGSIVRKLQEEFPDRLFMIERAGKTIYSKWMPTFHTIQKMSRGCMPPVPKRVRIWPSARGIATESV